VRSHVFSAGPVVVGRARELSQARLAGSGSEDEEGSPVARVLEWPRLVGNHLISRTQRIGHAAGATSTRELFAEGRSFRNIRGMLGHRRARCRRRSAQALPRASTASARVHSGTGHRRAHVDWPYDFPQRPPLHDEQRFADLRRLLHDHDIGLRERFAGSVLLLYAQPLTRSRTCAPATSRRLTAARSRSWSRAARSSCQSRSPRSRSLYATSAARAET